MVCVYITALKLKFTLTLWIWKYILSIFLESSAIIITTYPVFYLLKLKFTSTKQMALVVCEKHFREENAERENSIMTIFWISCYLIFKYFHEMIVHEMIVHEIFAYEFCKKLSASVLSKHHSVFGLVRQNIIVLRTFLVVVLYRSL